MHRRGRSNSRLSQCCLLFLCIPDFLYLCNLSSCKKCMYTTCTYKSLFVGCSIIAVMSAFSINFGAPFLSLIFGRSCHVCTVDKLRSKDGKKEGRTHSLAHSVTTVEGVVRSFRCCLGRWSWVARMRALNQSLLW